MNGILQTGQLFPSLKRSSPRDVRYGEGQYFSDLCPGRLTGAGLSRRLLGNPFQARRFTHFLEVDVQGLTVVKGRAGVFVIPNREPLVLAGRLLRSGRN